jgi:paraquat-inducible protein B
MTTDSGLGYRMDQALISFRDAAEALRVLAITLERNPDMLIRGADPRGPVR